MLLADGEHDRAFADYDEAVRLSPDDSEAYLERGVAHQSVGGLYEALDDFEAALKRVPAGKESCRRPGRGPRPDGADRFRRGGGRHGGGPRRV